MNATYREPLVATARGGVAHGGASLTALGLAVLEAYRRMEAKAASAASRLRSRRCGRRSRISQRK